MPHLPSHSLFKTPPLPFSFLSLFPPKTTYTHTTNSNPIIDPLTLLHNHHTTMHSSTEELATDDFDNRSINSTAATTTTITITTTTTTITTETKRSTSSGSEWTSSSLASPSSKPHAHSSNPCWDAIQRVKSEGRGGATTVGLGDLRFVHRLGSGDIGSVYLVELKGSNGCLFAAKVMDKKELVARNKESRARVEREILEILDHPFLPTLYATLESPRWSCLLTEFCPGGDLHVLRQRQPEKRFHEAAVRFYASEVVVALEYLHMMGIIYRDLKPENVLIRSDGHIMLTDFDLSLKGDDTSSMAQIVFDQDPPTNTSSNEHPKNQCASAMSSCILPNCIVPSVSCFHPKRSRKKKSSRCGSLEIIAEPIEIRSMSFVGTHEYLAPEIISGEGHGNGVDWWTLGVFIFELFYGITPFKGLDHELTLANIVARALEFPKEPMVPGPARDLITQLLVKDSTIRLGSTMGAVAIKHHPFFNGVNWPLLRCATPPYTPSSEKCKELVRVYNCTNNAIDFY